MIKRFAVIGAAGGFAFQTAITVFAYLAIPGVPGLFELAFQFLLICILAATGAAIGLAAGLIVGIAVSDFSRKKGLKHPSKRR